MMHRGALVWPTRLTYSQARTTLSGTGRTFEALGKRIWQTPRDLALVGYSAPTFLHLVCSPQRAGEFLRELQEMGEGWGKTKIIFEPMPADCISENLEALKAVLPSIEVFSPNEEEAARFLGVQLPEIADERRAAIEDVTRRMRALGAGTHVVIRSGALGACLDSPEGGCCWVPAYHGNTQKIVDFTGAGNAFLVCTHASIRTSEFRPDELPSKRQGGLASGLASTDGSADIVDAAMRGAVSASYMLEQYGPPLLQFAEGDAPQDRFNELSGRARHNF